jgi:hypothetical protein
MKLTEPMLLLLQRLPMYMGDPAYLRLAGECPEAWPALVARGLATCDDAGYLRLTAKGRDLVRVKGKLSEPMLRLMGRLPVKSTALGGEYTRTLDALHERGLVVYEGGYLELTAEGYRALREATNAR